MASPRKRRWLQFRLRTLLVFVVLVSLAMGWLGLQLKKLQQEQRDIELAFQTGSVFFQRHRPTQLAFWRGSPPYWLRRACGKEKVCRVSLTLKNPTPEDIRALPNIAAEDFDVYIGTVDDTCLKEVARLNNITRLWVDVIGFDNASTVTDTGISYLAGLDRLESLFVSGAKEVAITDKGLKYLTRLPNLRELALIKIQVSDEGLAEILKMEDLQDLGIQGDQIGDEGLAHISQHGRLEFVEVRSNQITDKGLAHLSTMSSLETLRLRASQITDAGLVHLGHMTNLKELRLYARTDDEHRVTDGAVSRLKRALPNCAVAVQWAD